MVCKEQIDAIEQKFVATTSKKWGCINATSEPIQKNNVQVSCHDSPKRKYGIPSFEQFNIHNDSLHKNSNQPKYQIEPKFPEKTHFSFP